MEILKETDSKQSSNVPDSETSPNNYAKASTNSPAEDKVALQGLLSEARNTKLVLEEFEAAIKHGTFQGVHMMALAKGCAFLTAVINQNKAHVQNLQERLKP